MAQEHEVAIGFITSLGAGALLYLIFKQQQGPVVVTPPVSSGQPSTGAAPVSLQPFGIQNGQAAANNPSFLGAPQPTQQTYAQSAPTINNVTYPGTNLNIGGNTNIFDAPSGAVNPSTQPALNLNYFIGSLANTPSALSMDVGGLLALLASQNPFSGSNGIGGQAAPKIACAGSKSGGCGCGGKGGSGLPKQNGSGCSKGCGNQPSLLASTNDLTSAMCSPAYSQTLAALTSVANLAAASDPRTWGVIG